MEHGEHTWVDPLHAIWVGIVIAHSKTTIANDIRAEVGAIHACDGAICVQVITPPAWICDDGMTCGESGEE